MAVGALVKAKEWREWFQHWRPTDEPRTGWERFLLDGAALLQESCVRDGRALRRWGNSMSVRNDFEGFNDDEFHDAVAVAERDLAWYRRNKATAEKDAPEWAKFLFRTTEGALISRVRHALELRQVAKRGYLTINVNPEARHKDFIAGREDFSGVEQQ